MGLGDRDGEVGQSWRGGTGRLGEKVGLRDGSGRRMTSCVENILTTICRYIFFRQPHISYRLAPYTINTNQHVMGSAYTDHRSENLSICGRRNCFIVIHLTSAFYRKRKSN